MNPADMDFVALRKGPRTAVYEITTTGQITDFNTGLAELLSSSAQALAGCSLLDFIHSQDRPVHLEALRRLTIGDLQDFDVIVRLCNRNGEAVWCRSIKHLVPGNGKRDAHIIGFFQELGEPPIPETAGSEVERMAAFASATIEGLVLSRKGRIIDCNPQFARMMGSSVADMTGRHIEDLVPPAMRDQLREHILRGYFPPTEFQVLRPDGGQLRVEAQAQRAGPGLEGTSITSVRDITEHWRREQELERLNHTLRAARDSSLALINATDETSYMHQVCRILVEDCGNPLVWIGELGRNTPDRLHIVAQHGWQAGIPDTEVPLHWLDAEGGISPIHQTIRERKTVVCPDISKDAGVDVGHRHQALIKGYASLVAIPLEMDSGIVGVITILDGDTDAFSRQQVQLLERLARDLCFGLKVLRDRAARVRAQEALDQRTRELEGLLNTIPAAVYVRDMDMRYRNVNPYFCREFGLRRDEVLGRRNEDILPAELAKACAVSDRRAIETGSVVHTQESMTGDDGGTLWWSTTTTLIYDARECPVGLVSVSTNITEEKQNEEARLAQVARQRDQLIREVHHRIKNHLQGVVGLLRGRAAETGEGGALFEEVIRQVLSIAQVYGLQSRGSDGRVELHELIRAICRGVGSVEWLQPDIETPVYIDPGEAVPVALVLNELMTNGLKHSRAATSQVQALVSVLGQRAEITVANSPGYLPAAFDFGAHRGLGAGLELVAALLPTPGALLDYSQIGDKVVACLTLTAPVVDFPDAVKHQA